ncbi:Ribokinase-like protein [Multifurca ochricompacta]|uniref:Ribokinase-like protein n=1 Tax=Multifurca ochricompacta TaxID=376703 RepID=A0AAD4QLV8_9AGAM|nr:Ribokinase-like protein [Multifurca ochricompacta]
MYPFTADIGNPPPAVLTIAGSDSGGGAGIQADLKTFTALECYGTSVITALTAQNTTGVQALHHVPPSFVEQQLRSVLDDIDIAAIKTGMLANSDVVRAVARTLTSLARPLPPLVVDPVCVSTSGHTLLDSEALGTLIEELFPLSTLLTPNTAEARMILQLIKQKRKSHAGEVPPITSIVDALRAARELCALGPCAVLLKGGHMSPGGVRLADVKAAVAAEDVHAVDYDGLVLPDANMEILFYAAQDPAMHDVPLVVDVLCERGVQPEGEDEGEGKKWIFTLFVRPYLDSSSTHGTGCTLSAALTCALARGEPLVEAVKLATMYTHHGIATAFPVGNGNGNSHGPLNHMHQLLPRVLNKRVPTPRDPFPFVRMLIHSNMDMWKQYVQHEFVRQLGKGTLSRERFLHFIKQDYHYLEYYARANGLIAAKSSEYADFAAAAQTVLAIVQERKMHVSFCSQWDINIAELERTPESPACTAYGAYIMDVGLQGDAASLLIALAACLLGYGEVGLWLSREAKRPQSWVKIEGNPYRKWIESYFGGDYQDAVVAGIERLEALVIRNPPNAKTLELWKAIWDRCTRLEKGFWDMAMDLS